MSLSGYRCVDLGGRGERERGVSLVMFEQRGYWYGFFGSAGRGAGRAGMMLTGAVRFTFMLEPLRMLGFVVTDHTNFVFPGQRI